LLSSLAPQARWVFFSSVVFPDSPVELFPPVVFAFYVLSFTLFCFSAFSLFFGDYTGANPLIVLFCHFRNPLSVIQVFVSSFYRES
jgi:hypothetical protein